MTSASLKAYSSKAEKYARYRWKYSPQAVEAICQIAGLNQNSQIADIGAGTGILAGQFAGRVGRIFAVEPNPEMRLLAGQALAGQPGCHVIAGTAEALPLGCACLDMVAAAHAAHWFEPQAARAEFRRVLKPGGWLALARNTSTDKQLSEALLSLNRPEYGVDFSHAARPLPGQVEEAYFEPAGFQKLDYAFRLEQDWEGFIGSLLSASYMPDENDPGYPALEGAARELFARYNRKGRLGVSGVTEIWIGRMPLES